MPKRQWAEDGKTIILTLAPDELEILNAGKGVGGSNPSQLDRIERKLDLLIKFFMEG